LLTGSFISSLITRSLIILSLFGSPVLIQAQSSYDPSTTESFSQATAGMTVLKAYTFGTNAGNMITNLQQLAANFNPYGVAKQTVIHTEWERYQTFNSTNFVFTPASLNLTATIPGGGGLFAGGINSAQIWSNVTFQPGKTGQNVYALDARMKIPGGQGMWPGFWLFSPITGDQSEIDIAEFQIMTYQNQYDWTGNDHGGNDGSTIYSILSNPWTWHPGTDFSAAFHDYQLVWTPDATYKYVDGQLILAQYFTWTSNQPAQMGLNLGVGSNDAGNVGLQPASLSEFPAALQVQSVTLYGGQSTSSGASGSTATVSYAGLDTATQGTFTGKYGNDGYVIANDVTGMPGYASLSITGDSNYIWASSTSDVRALQSWWNASSRLASCYWTNTNFNFNLALTDGNAHKISLYLLDWDAEGRAETVNVLDATTKQVLDTRTFGNFQGGHWASWTIKGNVVIQVQAASGNAVVSGIFFR
jgi:hypothetical protein